LPLHEWGLSFVFNKLKTLKQIDADLQATRHQSQVSFAEQLYQENAELKRENDLLQQRIDLLLDVDVDQPCRGLKSRDRTGVNR